MIMSFIMRLLALRTPRPEPCTVSLRRGYPCFSKYGRFQLPGAGKLNCSSLPYLVGFLQLLADLARALGRYIQLSKLSKLSKLVTFPAN